MYFQLPCFLKRAVAEALKLQKITVTFTHMYCTGQIFDTGFRGDIFFTLNFVQIIKILTSLKLVVMGIIIALISREPFDRIEYFFSPTFFFC